MPLLRVWEGMHQAQLYPETYTIIQNVFGKYPQP